MRVTLISLHPEVFSIGFRSLSSCLKRAGHEVSLILLPGDDLYKPKGQRYLGDYAPPILDSIIDLCRDSGLIGISLLTNYFLPAKTLTKALQAKLDVPVLWGGPHPTAQPEECLEYADMVCLGEGEEALLDLATGISSGQAYDRTPNIWLRRGNEIVRNNPRPLIQDIDTLSFPDCDLLGQYILDNGKIRTLDSKLLKRHSIYHAAAKTGVTYFILSSRGCNHKCSYCANDMWRCMYAGQSWLRWRSIESICDEVDYAIERIPDIEAVYFVDDNFAAMNVKRMQKFLRTYVSRVGLPFSLNLSPEFADSQRLDMLVRAGTYKISMGIQSASERILRMYKRPVSIKVSQEAVKRLEHARPLMIKPRSVKYHFIVDNPYESVEDKIATLKFILDMPRMPRRESVLCFSLVPYPGTGVYKMMREDGLIFDQVSQIHTKDFYLDLQLGFTKCWLYLFYAGIPASVLRVLLNPRLVKAVDLEKPKWLFRTIYWGLEQGRFFLGQIRQMLKTLFRVVQRTE